MKIKKEFNTLTPFGIVLIIILFIVMAVHIFIEKQDLSIWERILFSALWWISLIPFIGGGYIVLFFIFYGASKLSSAIFTEDQDNEDKLMEHFMALSYPLMIIFAAVGYIAVFFWS